MSNGSLSNEEFSCMKEFVEQHCGIALSDQKAYLIESRLAHLLVEYDCPTYSDLCFKAKNDRGTTLRNQIVDAMTTNETLWFRDKAPFTVLEEVLLKKYFNEIADRKRQTIRIWSAVCSTGQEPYSIAITVREFAQRNGITDLSPVEITATDISPTVLFLAKAGRYDQIAISRGLPDTIRERYFTQDGRTWKLDAAVKKMVTFQQFNLQDSFAAFNRFDIVFCRYVIIYFSDTFKQDLFKRFRRLLTPSGYLFLGASESLSMFNEGYILQTHNGHIYYQVTSQE
jgi:chemotaxis protein methyltransferase CheR